MALEEPFIKSFYEIYMENETLQQSQIEPYSQNPFFNEIIVNPEGAIRNFARKGTFLKRFSKKAREEYNDGVNQYAQIVPAAADLKLRHWADSLPVYLISSFAGIEACNVIGYAVSTLIADSDIAQLADPMFFSIGGILGISFYFIFSEPKLRGHALRRSIKQAEYVAEKIRDYNLAQSLEHKIQETE